MDLFHPETERAFIMIHVPDPLDTPVTLDTLRHQARHGMLDQTALRRAFVITGHTPANRDWIAFLNIGLLILQIATWILWFQAHRTQTTPIAPESSPALQDSP